MDFFSFSSSSFFFRSSSFIETNKVSRETHFSGAKKKKGDIFIDSECLLMKF